MPIEHFETVSHAVLARWRLKIRHYNRGRDGELEREISPQRLVHYSDNWYLDAWCHLRDGLRCFALESIREASLLDGAARQVAESVLDEELGSELLKMPFAEIIELLPARARRTYIRGLNSEQESFVRRLRGSEKPVRTHRREIPIIPEFVGKTVQLYNEKEFAPIEIKPEMIGHYLGEFALTRKSVRHSGLGVGATRSSKFVPLK